MAMLKVCIVDDHGLVRAAVRRALDAADDIAIVGEAATGREVMELVEREQPDLVLMDVRMPGLDGLSCLKLLRERHPAVTVVMLSACDERNQMAQAFAAGASAYIVKTINPEDLPSALRQAIDPSVFPAPESPDAEIPGAVDRAGLTEREATLLAALARGLSTKAISSELWISEKTVKFHLTNIYRKLGVHNRTTAMRYAYEHGLVLPEAEALGA